MDAKSFQRPLVDTSIGMITQHQAPTGAYIAAPGYGAYAYCWIRDGAFTADAMDAYGHHNSAANFHHWTARTIEHHAHKVELLEGETVLALQGTGDPLRPLDDRYVLHTRFTIDGNEGQDRWGNFQLDGYGFWLTSIARHLALTATDPAPYREAMDLVCRYLTLTWEHPCFDSWEEYPPRRHTTTWAAVAKGLNDSGKLLDDSTAVATSEEITSRLIGHTDPGGTLLKFVPDSAPEMHTSATETPGSSGLAVAGHERIGQPLDADTIDGSALLVLGTYGPFPPNHQIVAGTRRAIEHTLVVDGGVHRYLEDEYYGGGLWIVLAGALACVQAAHDKGRANETLNWIETHADANGHLGEQIASHLRKAESLEPWINRWGPPAKPLLWSHAMYLLGLAATQSGSKNPAAAPRS